MRDLNGLNEYNVPLHACNGYRQDEHYWTWLKSIRTHKHQGAGRQFYAEAWDRMPPRRQASFLRGFELSVAGLSSQIDKDMYDEAKRLSKG